VVVWLHIVALSVLAGFGMCWMGGEEDGHVDVCRGVYVWSHVGLATMFLA
jgi:hypothetical protein